MIRKNPKAVMMLACILLAAVLAGCGNGLKSEEDPALSHAEKSDLPVLSIRTADGALPGDEEGKALITVFRNENGICAQTTLDASIKIRGNTSRRFPKKSYRVTIEAENGRKANFPLLGLRDDDDWILNPMYSDTSKIREALGYELWNLMNSSGTHAASSRVVYAEVFINGEYWGLYAVQERVDRKQVSGDQKTGILYKIIANDRPQVEELLSCTSAERCRGIELAFVGSDVAGAYIPAAGVMDYLNGEEPRFPVMLDEDNLIDYGLWAMLTQAHDCRFKNQYWNAVEDGSAYTVYKLPWDLNNTFGDVWKSDAADTNFTDYYIGSLVMDSAFSEYLARGGEAAQMRAQARWKQLRESVITEEMLTAMAKSLYAPLFDAIERDSVRWPEGGMGNGNAANIRDIEAYIKAILPRMDAFFDLDEGLS